MVEIKDIATILETGLNALTQEVAFKVFASEGEYSEAVKSGRYNPVQQIPVVLRPIVSQVTPIEGLRNYFYQLVVETVVSTTYSEEVMRVLGLYIEGNVGKTGTLENYSYLFNMTLPEVGEKAQRPNVGDSVLISTTAYYQFISYGKIGNQSAITLDGESIMILSGGWARTKILDTANYNNTIGMRSDATAQSVGIKLVIPYRETTAIIALVNEIINEQSLTTTHTLSYSDGDVSTTSPLTVIMADAELGWEAGKISTVSISFVRARTA